MNVALGAMRWAAIFFVLQTCCLAKQGSAQSSDEDASLEEDVTLDAVETSSPSEVATPTAVNAADINEPSRKDTAEASAADAEVIEAPERKDDKPKIEDAKVAEPKSQESVLEAAKAEELKGEEATVAEAKVVEDPNVEEEATEEEANQEADPEDKATASQKDSQPTDASKSPAESTASHGDSELDTNTYQLRGRRLFGRQRVQLAINRPTYTESKLLREKLYGPAKEYGSVTGDWFPLDWWVNPGVAFRIGGSSVTGVAAKGTPTDKEVEEGTFGVDENSKTTLLFIPMMVAAKVEMTPFQAKWFVVDAWLGYEYGWWQETRGTATASAISWQLDTGTATQDPVLTTKGNKRALVLGGSMNFLLNWLDERTVRSMVDTIGLSHVYISPFFESVRSLGSGGLSFSRNSIGLGFTFESYK
ncbi:MAG: hypothetical protein NTV34_05955 [Proteobacteria bacterium]|nr:hypothetical protein [Pseudomonadota bacterium]